MPPKLNLVTSSVLRGFQMLFASVVIGLSVTLSKTYNNQYAFDAYTRPPTLLLLCTAVGGLSLVAAIFNFVVAWTECLREYIEMLVDIVVILANLVTGTVCIASTILVIELDANLENSSWLSGSKARIAAIIVLRIEWETMNGPTKAH
jgi:hypothetical protein